MIDAGTHNSVLLHAPNPGTHVELRALALEVRVAVDAAVVGELHALLGAFAALHALGLAQAVEERLGDVLAVHHLLLLQGCVYFCCKETIRE